MSKEDQNIPLELMARLRTHSEYGHLANPEGDPYKPFYRAISILLCHGGLAPRARKDAVADILQKADPYFIRALETHRKTFDLLYDFIYESWE